jgi:hypothetical protein
VPETVFAVEEALGLPGGALSSVLGYLPLGGRDTAASSVPAAIVADPLLAAAEKRGLLALYEELTATAAPRRRSRR